MKNFESVDPLHAPQGEIRMSRGSSKKRNEKISIDEVQMRPQEPGYFYSNQEALENSQKMRPMSAKNASTELFVRRRKSSQDSIGSQHQSQEQQQNWIYKTERDAAKIYRNHPFPIE